MFWKNKNKSTVVFNNRRQKLIDLLPPTMGMKHVPSWWKNKSNYKPHITSCSGIIELYKNAITVPLWIDYEIEFDQNNILNINVPNAGPENIYEYIVGHHPEQFNNAYPDYHHVKLINPWLIESDKVIPFLLIDTTWNRDSFDDYTIPPGIIEFKYQHSCHVNMFLRKENRVKKINLTAGSKLVHLIPLEKHDFDIQYRKIDHEKFLDLMPLVLTENHNYQKIRKLAEDNK